jgi:hypothetical protein
MTPDQIREFIQDGEWASITVELRPSSNKTPTGAPQPFYCSRLFKYSEPDHFECTVINFADPSGKVPLVKIHIKGLNLWRGEHPIAKGAYNVDYVADEAYEITPLHQRFADAANRFTASGLNHWEIGVAQDVQAKPFPLFCLIEGQTYVDSLHSKANLSRCHLDSERTNTSNWDAEPRTHWWKGSNHLKKEMESKIGC